MDPILVTPAGFERLAGELGSLRARRDVLLEGADGIDHLEELGRLERQIAALEDTLASVTVVEPDPGDGAIGVGEAAHVRDLESGESAEYRIVGTAEANPSTGDISHTSPVGAALLGRRVGDVVEVKVPRGLLRLEILEIKV